MGNRGFLENGGDAVCDVDCCDRRDCVFGRRDACPTEKGDCGGSVLASMPVENEEWIMKKGWEGLHGAAGCCG
jgi:hypothetical protein